MKRVNTHAVVGLELTDSKVPRSLPPGFGLGGQRRLPAQQRASDRDHHQAAPRGLRRRRRGPAQRGHRRRVREQLRWTSSSRLFLSVPLSSQVPGAVQAGQSVCEVRSGGPEERQQRLLQAQEQPAPGGVGAHDSVVKEHLERAHTHNSTAPPLAPPT